MRPGPMKQYHLMYEVQPNGCWHYTGSVRGNGYGQARGTSAHRYAWEYRFGALSKDLVVDHRCHKPESCAGGSADFHRRCINPLHLRPVSQRENVLRSNSVVAVKAANTHCPYGHPFSGYNLVVRPTQRACRICLAQKDRRLKARRRASALTPETFRPIHREVLAALAERPSSDGDMAERIGFAPQTIQLHRWELTRAGFVRPAGRIGRRTVWQVAA